MGEVVMRAPKLLCGAVLVAVVVFGLPSVVNAAAFIVSNTNDSGPGSLRQAIARANNNSGADTIFFVSGGSGKIILTSGQLLIRDDLTISGPGAGVLAVSGNQSSRVFDIESDTNVTIAGLTITEGFTARPEPFIGGGGGIRNFGSLTLDETVVTGNTVGGGAFESRGGGVYNKGFLTVANSVISDNFAQGFGGGISSDSFNPGAADPLNTSVTLIDTKVSRNSIGDGGGQITTSGAGIQTSGTPLVVNQSTIRANFSPVSGTSIVISQAPVTISGSTISRNLGGDTTPQGSIRIAEANASIENSRVVGNSTVGIYFFGLGRPRHSLVVRNSVISRNIDGGIYNDEGPVVLRDDTRVKDNLGPGVTNFHTTPVSQLTVRSSTISGNTAEVGGGIYNRTQATARLISSTVSNNTAVTGGGVYNQGTLTLESSAITSNTATGGPGSGGGVFNEGGTVTLDSNSSISNNIPDDCVGC
jgi:hypothetical protein